MSSFDLAGRPGYPRPVMRWLGGLVVLALALVSSREARAAEPAEPSRFGAEGQVVVSSALSASGDVTFTLRQEGRASRIAIGPSLDWFPFDRISVGGEVVFVRDVPFQGPRVDRLGARARLGYALSLTDAVTLWPMLSAGADAARASGHVTPAAAVGARIPLLLHVSPDFFVGIDARGERVFGRREVQLDAGGRTELSSSVLLGGVCCEAHDGVRRVDLAAGDARRPSPGPRFGDAGTVAFATSLGGPLRWQRTDGGGASLASAELALGVDWFVRRGLAIGLFGAGGVHDRTELANTPGRTNEILQHVRGGPRFAVDLRPSARFSFYPSLSLGVGVVDATTTVRSDRSGDGPVDVHGDDTDGVLGARLDLPVLFHATRHAFVGVGPFGAVETGLARWESVVRRTASVGGSLLVGGWL